MRNIYGKLLLYTGIPFGVLRTIVFWSQVDVCGHF